MSKVIVSPVKRFSGTVTLSDPLTFPQVIGLEESFARRSELGDDPTFAQAVYALLPGLLPCVEKWELSGFPATVAADNFPATPRDSVARLIAWLVKEVSALYKEAEEVPNA